ncbi:competence protein ComEA helix-hairpin-helix repeat protein [Desulforamulus reducens MI-1]|uniref:Competence protein ComEA helix-hairpin-helix repeat protein n=1 Tax=Desulforamulus reducens (strain ATCC BAA-1160 / DSM 100696 / MI-1) TaxID=349161 RepID=A4J7G9_DESRM|nr:competence protein ComEA helix-hairpin-helix repeat protein [Desulforamulus reducens MI-1]
MPNLGRKEQVIILIIMAVVLYLAGYQFASRANTGVELVNSQSSDSMRTGKEETEIQVHVDGAVEKPDVYHLPAGSRVHDALKLAVPTQDADLSMLNLAAPLKDGQKLPIPSKAEQQASEQRPNQMDNVPSQGVALKASKPLTPTVAQGTGLVNINTAGPQELDSLPGIGPALAERIIQHREANGPFQCTEDLKNVSGIGDKKFEDLQHRITLQ